MCSHGLQQICGIPNSTRRYASWKRTTLHWRVFLMTRRNRSIMSSWAWIVVNFRWSDFRSDIRNCRKLKMFSKNPWNLNTWNLPSVRCQDELVIVLWIAITSLQRILQAAMLPILHAAIFLNRFSNSTSVHVKRMNPVFWAAPVLHHRCRFPRLKKVALFQR